MPFIVMEFVEGASLQEIIKSGKAISLQKSLSIISQLLKALHAAHQLSIVHRDIKAANVMILKEGGSVKLADFGIARIAESPELTMTGAVVGTPRYMAPEQMFGLKVDARADLFSVAMVFLDLLALLPKSSAIPRSSLPEIENIPPNNRIDNTRVSNPSTMTSITEVRTLDDEMLKKMGEDYAGYIGPLARRLVQHHAATTSNLEQLVELLASEIPDIKDREKFKTRWLRS